MQNGYAYQRRFFVPQNDKSKKVFFPLVKKNQIFEKKAVDVISSVPI